jgi:competence ComEA-like helix-hairpin-helix protein
MDHPSTPICDELFTAALPSQRPGYVQRRARAARTRWAALAMLLSAAVVLIATVILARQRPMRRLPDDAPRLGLDVKINVNTSDAASLAVLPGIGPALAERIIADRNASGPFRDAQDLQRVKGIGPRTVARLGPWMAF